MPNELFETAVEQIGQAYLEAEQELISLGESILPFLQEQARENGIRGLVATVLINWIQQNPSFRASLDFLEETEEAAAASVMGAPPIDYVAGFLKMQFGDGPASLLSLYMVKLRRIWPAWMTESVILYLGRMDSPRHAEALLLFVKSAAFENQRDMASLAIVATGDSAVLAKLESELTAPDLDERVLLALRQARDGLRNRLEPVG